MKKIKFLPTVYTTIALLASVLFFSQIQSQKNLTARKELQDVTKVSAKDAPPEPKYVPGEIIVKLKTELTLSKPDKAGSMSLGNDTYFQDQIDKKALPETLLKYSSKIHNLRKIFREKSSTVKDPQYKDSFDKTYLFNLDKETDITAVLFETNLDPKVEYAEPNYVMEAYVRPNDPYYNDAYPDNIPNRDPNWNPQHDYQWNLKKINAESAWEITRGGEDVKVAVVDTGVDCTIEEMVGRCEPGFDFINNDDDPMDDFGHGTHVTGTIVSNTDNSVGLAGVSWFTKIVPIKSLNNTGSGSLDSISAGIIEAVNRQAKIINLSLGMGPLNGIPMTLQMALDFAYDSNVTIVAASGNSNDDLSNGYWPANYHTVISVGATDELDRRASFSNYGNNLTVVAPGGKGSEYDGNNFNGRNVLSLRSLNNGFPTNIGGGGSVVEENYVRARGTSMASPHVAGLASLLLALNQSLTPLEIKNIIANGADDLGQPGDDRLYGYGRINALTSLTHMDTSSPPIALIVDPISSLTLNPSKGVTFKGYASSKSFGKLRLEYARVSDPGAYTLICESFIQVNEYGQLCTWNAQIQDGEYIIRLTVLNDNNVEQASYITGNYVDNQLNTATPIKMRGINKWGPAIADLNGDGRKEIINGTRDGWVSVYNEDGSLFEPWTEKHFGTGSWIDSKPVVGNLDDDAGLEIIFKIFTSPYNPSLSGIYAFNYDGTAVVGAWPKHDSELGEGTYLLDAFTLADINYDGVDEVLAQTTGYVNSAYVWKSDGSNYSAGWPANLGWEEAGAYTQAVPVVEDIDSNVSNGKEIIFRRTKGVKILSSDSSTLVTIILDRNIDTNYYPHPLIGDVDGDGLKEILLVDRSLQDNTPLIRLFHFDGSEIITANIPIRTHLWSSIVGYVTPILTNIDTDIYPEIIYAKEVFDNDGKLLANLRTEDDRTISFFTPISGDINGSGMNCGNSKEVFGGIAFVPQPKLYGWNTDGTYLSGFPKFMPPNTEGNVIKEMSVPLIVDFQNKHEVSLVFINASYLYTYNFGNECKIGLVDWPESNRNMKKDSSYKKPGQYWKSFTFRGQPGQNIDTAEELLDLLYSRGLKPIEIDRFLNGGWDAHPINLPFNNFILTPGVGYLVSFDENPKINIDPLINNYTSPVTSLNYSLSPGYTMIGIPTNLLQNININGAVAEDLCNYIYTQSNQIVSDIGYWDSSAADWNWHTCGGLVNNFSLDGETPLMLKANAYFNFSIPYTRTRSAQNKVNPIQKKSSSKSTERPKVPSLPR